MALKIELGLTPNAMTMQKSEDDTPKLLLVDQGFQMNLSALKALGLGAKREKKTQVSFILISKGRWMDDNELYLVDSTNLLLPDSGKFTLTQKGKFSNMAIYEQVYFPGNNVLKLDKTMLKITNQKIPALKILINER